ncbi:MAG TPA: 50S ribosomal protein L3 [Gemmatimonadaceae bacterium]|nr:50S ribosomal protein L3 [Gemmatimonadaceae bacterium]
MIGMIGKKLGMTQIFNEQGQQIPVTVVEAPPNPVLAVTVKTATGIAAVQLGFGAQRLARDSKKGERTPRGRRANRAELGHAKKAGLEAPPRVLRSFRLDSKGNAKAEIPTYAVGDVINVGVFEPGELVKVTGTTKGHGFQGVVKRHGIGGGPNTHGNTKHRRPGSVGPGTDPSRVIKGKKMPGHYGAERHTQVSGRVERVDAERNLIYIRGSVAGPANGIVLVQKQGHHE